MNEKLNSKSDEQIWEKHLETVRALLSIGRKANMDNLERAKSQQSAQQNYLKIPNVR